MRILGIIAEYNPLHNGHLYHLNEAKKTPHDLVIAIITNTFNSRGEISLLSAKEKTQLLLQHSVDIVISLPFVYGTQNADIFAYKAVEILNHFKVTDIISGSESNNIDYINELITTSNSDKYHELIKKYLDKGLSYKVASNNALCELGLAIPSSNDILNWKYAEAISKINTNINLSFVKRIKADYHDKIQNDKHICSATSIRTTKNYINYVPTEVSSILDNKGLITLDNLFPFISYLRLVKTNISNLNFISEGLDNAFYNSTSSNYEALILELTTKRYTSSRIRRMLLQILFNITKEQSSICLSEEIIPRVLGFNNKGKDFLSSIKKERKYFTNLRSNINLTYDIEIKILKLISMIYKNNDFKDNQQMPIYYKS